MKHLIIIGTGSGGRQVFRWAKRAAGYGTEWGLKGYINGDRSSRPEELEKLSLPLLGDAASYPIDDEDVFVCSIGTPAVRERIIKKLMERGAKFVSLVHEAAYVEDGTVIGNGVVIGPGTYVDGDTVLQDHVFVDVKCSIGHDVLIGPYSFVAACAAVSGSVRTGKAAYFGANSTVVPDIEIGENALVGAGSVVLGNVRDNTRVFGVPAEPIPSFFSNAESKEGK